MVNLMLWMRARSVDGNGSAWMAHGRAVSAEETEDPTRHNGRLPPARVQWGVYQNSWFHHCDLASPDLPSLWRMSRCGEG